MIQFKNVLVQMKKKSPSKLVWFIDASLEIILMNICLKLCDFREIANFWVMLAGYILCYVHLTSVNIALLFYTWLLRHNKLWYYLSCCIHVVTLLNLMRKKLIKRRFVTIVMYWPVFDGNGIVSANSRFNRMYNCSFI